MSTKSMRPPPRRVAWGNNSSSTPSNGNGSSSSSKRKDEERYHDGFKRPTTVPTAPMPKLFKPNKPIAEPKPTQNKSSNPMVCSSSSKGPIPQINNQLLAGYMAHEFLTKGTLMGRPWGPKPSPGVEPLQQKHERYVEVTTHLLKKDGTHLRGVVNPTQLAHVLRLT